MKIAPIDNSKIYIINYDELIEYKMDIILLNENMFHEKVISDFRNAKMRISYNGRVIVSGEHINSWLFFKCKMPNVQDRFDFTTKILGYYDSGSWPVCKDARDSLLLLTKLLIKYNQISLE